MSSSTSTFVDRLALAAFSAIGVLYLLGRFRSPRHISSSSNNLDQHHLEEDLPVPEYQESMLFFELLDTYKDIKKSPRSHIKTSSSRLGALLSEY